MSERGAEKTPRISELIRGTRASAEPDKPSRISDLLRVTRTADADRPRRVVVTSPRTAAARRPRQPLTREIDEQTEVGAVYMRSLIQTQFRLALFVCTVLACVVGGLPLLFLLVPELRAVHVLGLPMPWVVLAGLIYPAFVIGAWLYVRQAERNERHFAELVERR